MKKPLIILFSLILSNSLFAKNIVLLSSLTDKDFKATTEIKRQFYKKLYGIQKHGNQLIYVDKATTDHLYKYLNDSETVALFWVSHGGHIRRSRKNTSGIGATSVLVDFQKVNVAKVFQKVHPNIKYLGILGCNSRQIVSSHLEKRKDLGIYMPSYSVVATWSFRVALRKFKRHYWNNQYNYLQDNVLIDGYPITIKREVSKDSKALMVFAGKKLIGVMDELNAGEIQSNTFYIPYYEGIKRYDFKIIIKSGLLTKNLDDFGEIEVSYENQKLWKLFAKRDGTPFGVNERIYIFKSNIKDIELEQGVVKYEVSN